mmetsp:Transcript_13422/g.32797  ORF Transcript_13422/g.32797 Transcript_13422/m.32797 type:complete len:200 (+) Transcript_13422:55-654(+)
MIPVSVATFLASPQQCHPHFPMSRAMQPPRHARVDSATTSCALPAAASYQCRDLHIASSHVRDSHKEDSQPASQPPSQAQAHGHQGSVPLAARAQRTATAMTPISARMGPTANRMVTLRMSAYPRRASVTASANQVDGNRAGMTADSTRSMSSAERITVAAQKPPNAKMRSPHLMPPRRERWKHSSCCMQCASSPRTSE